MEACLSLPGKQGSSLSVKHWPACQQSCVTEVFARNCYWVGQFDENGCLARRSSIVQLSFLYQIEQKA